MPCILLTPNGEAQTGEKLGLFEHRELSTDTSVAQVSCSERWGLVHTRCVKHCVTTQFRPDSHRVRQVSRPCAAQAGFTPDTTSIASLQRSGRIHTGCVKFCVIVQLRLCSHQMRQALRALDALCVAPMSLCVTFLCRSGRVHIGCAKHCVPVQIGTGILRANGRSTQMQTSVIVVTPRNCGFFVGQRPNQCEPCLKSEGTGQDAWRVACSATDIISRRKYQFDPWNIYLNWLNFLKYVSSGVLFSQHLGQGKVNLESLFFDKKRLWVMG